MATNNGDGFPRNLTNAFDKREFKEQTKENKKVIREKRKEEKNLTVKGAADMSQLTLKARKDVDPDNGIREMMPHLKFPYDFPFINFANHYQYLKYLERFKLVIKGHKKDSTFAFFVPHLLTVEVMLIHGCEVLARSTTKSIPFNYAPRFNQWLTLKIQESIPEVLYSERLAERKKTWLHKEKDPRDWDFIRDTDQEEAKASKSYGKHPPGLRKVDWDIRYCQLPKKSKLAFNIKAVSSNGEERVIASATFLVFDNEGNFKEGKHSLKLWPFYRVDERLGCMK